MKLARNTLFKAFARFLVFSVVVCAGTANAAVFVLKGVNILELDDVDYVGEYSVTGEFKVDTSGSTQSPSAWNIRIDSTSGGSSLNRTYVKNTAGFVDNSYANEAFTSGKAFTLCTDVDPSDCSYSISMAFNTDFKAVYQDGTNRAAPIPGKSGTTTLGTITLKSAGNVADTLPSDSQADFVPFSPAFVGFLPVAGLLLRLKRRHSSKSLCD